MFDGNNSTVTVVRIPCFNHYSCDVKKMQTSHTQGELDPNRIFWHLCWWYFFLWLDGISLESMKIISTHSTLENITRAVLLNLTSAPFQNTADHLCQCSVPVLILLILCICWTHGFHHCWHLAEFLFRKKWKRNPYFNGLSERAAFQTTKSLAQLSKVRCFCLQSS